MVNKNGVYPKVSIVRKITLSGVFIGLYVVIMFFTQSFAFGQYQVRIATSLYALSAIYPFLIVPMGIANFLSNLLGGMGPFDMFGGLAAGIATTFVVYIIKRLKLSDWFISIPIVLIPGFMVPIWLTYITHIPYEVLALSICIGQIVPGIVGVIIVKQLKVIGRKTMWFTSSSIGVRNK